MCACDICDISGHSFPNAPSNFACANAPSDSSSGECTPLSEEKRRTVIYEWEEEEEEEEGFTGSGDGGERTVSLCRNGDARISRGFAYANEPVGRQSRPAAAAVDSHCAQA